MRAKRILQDVDNFILVIYLNKIYSIVAMRILLDTLIILEFLIYSLWAKRILQYMTNFYLNNYYNKIYSNLAVRLFQDTLNTFYLNHFSNKGMRIF